MVFCSLGEDSYSHHIPPPPLPAEFPEKVQLDSSGTLIMRHIPPPTQLAEFPKKVQFAIRRRSGPPQ